eukprot:jgi/Psemu1/56614/gm1.56614_g
MFLVPFLNPYDEEFDLLVDEDTPHKHAVLAALSQTRVCKYAVTVILDWGRRKWETCLKNLQENTTPSHGLKGKRPNNTRQFDNSDIVEDLADFFDDLKKLGQPQSTRILHIETGVGLRDREEVVVDLPPSYSKRSLYYQFCYDHGWNVTLKKNSNSVLKVALFEEILPQQETRQQVVLVEFCKQNDVYAPLVMEPEAALSENNKILTE